MDYELWFWLLIAFLGGRFIPRRFYVGTDKQKYERADMGMLLHKKVP